MLTARRGILRGFGFKVGKITPRSFARRIRELVAGHPKLQAIAQALLSMRAVLLRELDAFKKRVRCMARADAAKLLMSAQAVGPIVALTNASAIDDPARLSDQQSHW